MPNSTSAIWFKRKINITRHYIFSQATSFHLGLFAIIRGNFRARLLNQIVRYAVSGDLLAVISHLWPIIEFLLLISFVHQRVQ